MMTDYRQEIYDLMVSETHKSKCADIAGVMWDISEAVAKRLKEERLRSRNFEMMLRRIVSKHIRGKLDAAAIESAARLLERIGTGGILREGNAS